MPLPKPTPLRLTKKQKDKLHGIKPVGKRAELMAEFYLLKKYKAAVIIDSSDGADITISANGNKLDFEVKGTEDKSIALNKLKVSSKNSHQLITSGITVIRIMEADTDKPTVAELKYGKHFKLKAEPRWRAKATS